MQYNHLHLSYLLHYTSTSITLLLHIITYTSPTYCAIHNYLYYCSHLSYLLHYTPYLLPLLLHYRSHLSYLLHYTPYLYYHYYSITAHTSPTYFPIPLTSITYTSLSYLYCILYA